jgi:hypothetical protein
MDGWVAMTIVVRTRRLHQWSCSYPYHNSLPNPNIFTRERREREGGEEGEEQREKEMKKRVNRGKP